MTNEQARKLAEAVWDEFRRYASNKKMNDRERQMNGPHFGAGFNTALAIIARFEAEQPPLSGGLTDEEIIQLALSISRHGDVVITNEEIINFARAIEQRSAGQQVAVVDEGDEGLFADLETPNGVMVKRGDKLYTAPLRHVANVSDQSHE